jgi:hypothetical protein
MILHRLIIVPLVNFFLLSLFLFCPLRPIPFYRIIIVTEDCYCLFVCLFFDTLTPLSSVHNPPSSQPDVLNSSLVLDYMH